MTLQLRDRLTPFGEQLAAALAALPAEDGLIVRVVSAADAIEPMRRILARHGLEEKKRVVYRDGSLGVSWHEEPSIYIKHWINSESAIVCWEDDRGPVELQFLRRLSTERVETVYVIGMRSDRGSTHLSDALGQLGIREIAASYNVTRTSPGFIAKLHARGFEVTAEEGEWVHIRRPIRAPNPESPA